MMTMKSSLFVILCVLPAAAVLRGHNAVIDTSNILVGDIRGHMQPEVVAHLLAEVEHNWIQDRLAAFEKTTTEETAVSSMISSCSKVATSIVQGSNGEYERVKEYMKYVCAASQASSNDQTMCKKFADGIQNFMMGDPEFNRKSLNLPKFCTSFFEGAVTDGAKVLQEQRKEEELARQAAEQQRKEAEQKQEAEEAAKREEEAAKREEAQRAQQAQAEAKAQKDKAEVAAKIQAARLPQKEQDELSRELQSYYAAKERQNATSSSLDDDEDGMWYDGDDSDNMAAHAMNKTTSANSTSPQDKANNEIDAEFAAVAKAKERSRAEEALANATIAREHAQATLANATGHGSNASLSKQVANTTANATGPSLVANASSPVGIATLSNFVANASSPVANATTSNFVANANNATEIDSVSGSALKPFGHTDIAASVDVEDDEQEAMKISVMEHTAKPMANKTQNSTHKKKALQLIFVKKARVQPH